MTDEKRPIEPDLARGERKRLSPGRLFFRRVAPTVAFGVLLYLGLTHIASVMGALRFLMALLTPLLVGGALAFLLNLPMRRIERRLPKKWPFSLRRGLSLLLCFLLLILFVSLVALVVFPQMGSTITSLLEKVPAFLRKSAETVTAFLRTHLPELAPKEDLGLKWETAAENLWSFLSKNLPSMLSATASFAGQLASFLLGIAVCGYILASKEKLSRQARKLCYAYVPEHRADRIMEIASLTHRTFCGFVTGQLTEACILGSLCAVGALIFGFPLPLLCGVLMAIGGLVPIFGPIVVTILCALLVAVEGGFFQALGFVVFVVILQQFEGNLIYPRVVGDAVGLPGLWVLLSLTVGGAVMGLSGMLIAVPVASVLAVLLRQNVNHRLKKKAISPEKTDPPKKPPEKRKRRLFQKKNGENPVPGEKPVQNEPPVSGENSIQPENTGASTPAGGQEKNDGAQRG